MVRPAAPPSPPSTRVRLLRLERQALFQVIDDDPGIAIAICQTLSRRVRNVIDKLEQMDKKPHS